jgi:hypothetical protein
VLLWRGLVIKHRLHGTLKILICQFSKIFLRIREGLTKFGIYPTFLTKLIMKGTIWLVESHLKFRVRMFTSDLTHGWWRERNVSESTVGYRPLERTCHKTPFTWDFEDTDLSVFKNLLKNQRRVNKIWYIYVPMKVLHNKNYFGADLKFKVPLQSNTSYVGPHGNLCAKFG